MTFTALWYTLVALYVAYVLLLAVLVTAAAVFIYKRIARRYFR